ncbi:hypothetical protein QMN58_29780, partial [Escherichia coli]|nr:hypothetical protein [Escherichia coli]
MPFAQHTKPSFQRPVHSEPAITEIEAGQVLRHLCGGSLARGVVAQSAGCFPGQCHAAFDPHSATVLSIVSVASICELPYRGIAIQLTTLINIAG